MSLNYLSIDQLHALKQCFPGNAKILATVPKKNYIDDR
jgi:hypothetical protein